MLLFLNSMESPVDCVFKKVVIFIHLHTPAEEKNFVTLLISSLVKANTRLDNGSPASRRNTIPLMIIPLSAPRVGHEGLFPFNWQRVYWIARLIYTSKVANDSEKRTRDKTPAKKYVIETNNSFASGVLSSFPFLYRP